MSNKGWFGMQMIMLCDKYNEDCISAKTGTPYKIDQCSKCGGCKKEHYNYENWPWCSCSGEELGQIIPVDEKMRDKVIKCLSLPENLIPFLDEQEPIDYENMSELGRAIFDRRFHMIIEKTDVLTVYYGTNLTKPLKPHIQECLSQGKCSYTVTGDVYIRQKGFRCLTCYPKDKTMAFCESCIKTCHRGHDTYLPIIRDGDQIKPRKLFMFCDCSVTNRCCL